MLDFVLRAGHHRDRIAFRTPLQTTTYAALLERSAGIAGALLSGAGVGDLAEERIAFLVPAGEDYAALQWGIWRAGGVAVPLNRGAAMGELLHVLRTAGVSRVIAASAGEALQEAAATAGATITAVRALEGSDSAAGLPELEPARRAMIVFTSGTTSKPKGSVATHANLVAMMSGMEQAWGWRADDCIPLFLPLHHVHGIVNVLGCALWTGACIEPFDGFPQDVILQRVEDNAYTVFMAVPTLYVKLITALEAMPEVRRDALCGAFGRMRLMVSGSAALPATVHQRWEELTGQRLLERYGMTEIGMALSNPLVGERRSGSVGLPMPGVDVRLVEESGAEVIGEDIPGEIQVRGASIFLEYWNNPGATAACFTEDGWFRTGDVAVRERGYYRIMGRQSVDIIKSGGYKLSALEIEGVLLEHPMIAECAVLGLPDATWGEVVAAVVVLREDASLDDAALRAWCEKQMSTYKQPRRFLFVSALPRNAMGKVVKPDVRTLFGS
jgi:malonyl-CoA/methylmalonyl-CoA synthetase